MIRKFPLLVFIVGLVGLILFQGKVIMPLVYDVIKSDLFLEETDDIGSANAISNEMTEIAFSHCNNYIKNELDDDYSVNYAAAPLYAWSIGNHQYVINAEIEVNSPETKSQIKRYVCRISYGKGNDNSGLMDPDNWSVYGLSGIDEI